MEQTNSFVFAPQLYIPHGTKDILFYQKAFGAALLRTWNNDDGSVHVAEWSLNCALFYLHENSERLQLYSPADCKGVGTTVIGLFVEDVQAVVEKAVGAGAVVLSPVTDYEYGYRQGEIRDPFGHIWMIQKKI